MSQLPSHPSKLRRKTVYSVPVDQLHPHPYQPRQTFREEPLQELADSLKNNEQKEDIHFLYDSEKRQYIIKNGERRWRAAQIAGITHLEGKFMGRLENENAADLLAAQFLSNAHREPHTQWEIADFARRMRDDHGKTVEEIAETLGKSRSNASKHLRVFSAPEWVRDMLRDEWLTLAHIQELLKHVKHDAVWDALEKKLRRDGKDNVPAVSSIWFAVWEIYGKHLSPLSRIHDPLSVPSTTSCYGCKDVHHVLHHAFCLDQECCERKVEQYKQLLIDESKQKRTEARRLDELKAEQKKNAQPEPPTQKPAQTEKLEAETQTEKPQPHAAAPESSRAVAEVATTKRPISESRRLSIGGIVPDDLAEAANDWLEDGYDPEFLAAEYLSIAQELLNEQLNMSCANSSRIEAQTKLISEWLRQMKYEERRDG